MAKPSSQVVSKWVVWSATTAWVELIVLIQTALSTYWTESSETQRFDLASEYEDYVRDHLADNLKSSYSDGVPSLFEFDPDSQYVRAVNGELNDILKELREMTPRAFECLCKEILNRLGGNSEVTPISNDGGVDFYSFNLKGHARDGAVPDSSQVSVVGQAKRWCEGNIVNLEEIRKFIGGALLKVDEYRKQGRICVLTPVIYAFWTTSDFHPNARQYARDMGLWTLEGHGVASYVKEHQIEIDKISL